MVELDLLMLLEGERFPYSHLPNRSYVIGGRPQTFYGKSPTNTFSPINKHTIALIYPNTVEPGGEFFFFFLNILRLSPLVSVARRRAYFDLIYHGN